MEIAWRVNVMLCYVDVGMKSNFCECVAKKNGKKKVNEEEACGCECLDCVIRNCLIIRRILQSKKSHKFLLLQLLL